jgi:hypothetical protein
VTGRDANGRFTNGNGGGPGRPPKEREERFLEITLSAVTYQDWRDIIKKAVDQAKRGNPQARKFLADYLLGVPKQRHELTGADGGPVVVEHDLDADTITEALAILGTADSR